MERMKCVWEEKIGLGNDRTRILMDNMTGVQYLVVCNSFMNGGIAVTPLLNKDGGILCVYSDQAQ